MSALWNTLIYNPIYNALVFISQHVALKDVGVGVIIITLLIRLVLSPLSKKSIKSQYALRELDPKLKEIKNRNLSKEEEAKQTFALYKEKGINPFSGCLYMLIQLPIIFALYRVFIHGIYQPEHLYPFLSTDGLDKLFLGVIDITKPFLPFAILAGITQAVQAFLMPKQTVPGDGKGFQAQFTKSMSTQTRYVLPIFIIFIAQSLASAVSLYWSVANLFSIGQELYFRKTIRRKVSERSN